MALTYIPVPGQNLLVTRDPINNNWTSIDATISQDHIDTNLPNTGKHKTVTLVNQQTNPNAPATVAGETMIYGAPSLVAPNAPAIFIKEQNSGAAVNGIEITYALKMTNGWTQLPSRIVLQWGFVNLVGAPQDVMFPITFPNAVFNVQLTCVKPAGSSNGHTDVLQVLNEPGDLTTAKFRARSRSLANANENSDAYFFAIGY